MRHLFKTVTLGTFVLLSFGTPIGAQSTKPGSTNSSANATAADPCDDFFSKITLHLKAHLADIKDQLKKPATDERVARAALYDDVQDWSVYACELAPDALQAGFFAEAEQKRLDKQPGATSNSSGTTSLSSKGSSPSLLGFALEHGGLTQTAGGNTITFRGNVANSIRALMNSTYLGSYQLGEYDPLVVGLAKLSFGVSFDASSNQPSTTQGFAPSKNSFSGFSAKYELINHRDPREARYRKEFERLTKEQGYQIAHASLHLNDLVRHNLSYKDWSETVFKSLQEVRLDATDEDLQKLVRDARNLFLKLFSNDPEIKRAAGEDASRINDYMVKKNDLYGKIRGTSLLTVEYTLTRQLTTNNQNISPTQPKQQVPDLSNINLIFEKGIQGSNSPEFTFNTAVTLFNSSNSSDPKRGRVRDYRAMAQLDVPLKEIANIGRPVLSFSGQFLGLLEEPLGQKVTINGVTVDRRGNIGIFQTKISIPVKDSGIKIPISFTYASRTELIKESDKRGNIGITFDLDTLFSKPK